MWKDLKVEEWVDELNRGLEYRREYGLEDTWSTNEAMFYNLPGSDTEFGPNIVASTGDALMSNLTVPYPYISLRGRRPGLMDSARLSVS